jgi:DNA repair exonuclease SbcCD nuclease subunit
MLRFIHTSDWQLGMPFHWVKGDGAAKLRELRMLAVDRLRQLAEEHQVAFVIVAGDLFDANTIAERVILDGLDRLKAFPCPVFVIPGNHDHGGPGSVYGHDLFKQHRPPNLVVLHDRQPIFHADAPAWLLPAPLLQRHEAIDPTAHIVRDLGGHDAPRIGIAHGSIRRFDQSGDGTVPNLIDPTRATVAELDYLALGDWHGCQQIDARTWYCGTPEPTSFKDNDPGKALLVGLQGGGTLPEIEELHIGQARWVSHATSLFQPTDVDALRHTLQTLPQARLTLLNLTLKGSLSISELTEVRALIEETRLRLLHYQEQSDALYAHVSSSELDAIASDGYVRMAVDRLISREKQGDRNASHALQLLYQLKRSTC